MMALQLRSQWWVVNDGAEAEISDVDLDTGDLSFEHHADERRQKI
jgi:hypothetical protein